MCRLLGFAAASPTSLGALVGERQLATFTALSRVHADGWGTSWLAAHEASDGVQTATSTVAAATDPDFAVTAEQTFAAAASAARALRRHYPHASLNALLLTSTELVVLHAHSPLGAPLDDLSVVPGGAPLDHDAAYFLMRWLRTADGSLVFASSGMQAHGWTSLPEQSVTTVELRTLKMRHVLLGADLLGEDEVAGRVA